MGTLINSVLIAIQCVCLLLHLVKATLLTPILCEDHNNWSPTCTICILFHLFALTLTLCSDVKMEAQSHFQFNLFFVWLSKKCHKLKDELEYSAYLFFCLSGVLWKIAVVSLAYPSVWCCKIVIGGEIVVRPPSTNLYPCRQMMVFTSALWLKECSEKNSNQYKSFLYKDQPWLNSSEWNEESFSAISLQLHFGQDYVARWRQKTIVNKSKR